MDEHEGKHTEADHTKHEPDAAWQFNTDDGDNAEPVTSLFMPMKPHTAEIAWTASEFVANQKASGWYVLLALGASFGSILVYTLTRDAISSGMIILAALVLAIFAARQPRVLDYKVDAGGIQVSDKFYPFASFRSFSVQDEGPISLILFIPFKKLMPPLTVYYEPKDEEHIVTILGNHLPFENRKQDVVDSLMRKIRF